MGSIRCFLKFILSYTGVLFLAAIKKRNTVYVVTAHSIGDFLYGVSYLSYFRETKLSANIILLADKSKKKLVEGIMGYNKVVYYDKSSFLYKTILSYILYKNGSLARKCIDYNILIAYPWNFRSSRNILYDLRHTVFRFQYLPRRISYPVIETCKGEAYKSLERENKKIVILNPYSISMKTLPMWFWNHISERLSEQGYLVCTNVVGNQTVLKKTLPLRCSIVEFYSIVKDLAFVVISMRSGLVDLIVSTGSKLIVLYNYEVIAEREFFRYYNIKETWGRTEDIYEVIYDKEMDIEKDIISLIGVEQ